MKKLAKAIIFVAGVWLFMATSYFLSTTGYDILVSGRIDLRSATLEKFWIVSTCQAIMFCLLAFVRAIFKRWSLRRRSG